MELHYYFQNLNISNENEDTSNTDKLCKKLKDIRKKKDNINIKTFEINEKSEILEDTVILEKRDSNILGESFYNSQFEFKMN